MKLSFFGADQCVTGSCHCLEVGGKRILIDCGLQQGRDEVDNRSLPFAPGSIDYVLITHAHIDHSGRVPMLIKNGFQGRILTTRLTAQLMSIMLQDSAHIQESDAEYKNRKNRRAGRPEEEPLYTVADAQRVPEFIDTCEYDQPVHLCDGVDAVFIDAGHLLGSASIRLTLTEGGETRTIVFSGAPFSFLYHSLFYPLYKINVCQCTQADNYPKQYSLNQRFNSNGFQNINRKRSTDEEHSYRQSLTGNTVDSCS